MFLLPGNVPHSPIRFANTVGIVVEQNRPADSVGPSLRPCPFGLFFLTRFWWMLTKDRLRWYCATCGEIVYEDSFHMTDLGTQVKGAVEKFAASEGLRTCKKCGTVAKTKLYDS